MPDDGKAAFSLSAVELYDLDFGPRMVCVTPPGVPVSPHTTLSTKALGKAPGYFSMSGWSGTPRWTDPNHRCLDWNTAKEWENWGANIGFLAGDGYVIIDNDQGAAFSHYLQQVFVDLKINPPRRYVLDPKGHHLRDAFILRVILPFIGPADVGNSTIKLVKGQLKGELQILAHGKQAVISGTHPGTMAPYVLDQRLSLGEIPSVSEQKFSEIIRKFLVLAVRDGWVAASVPQAVEVGGVRGNGAAAPVPASTPRPPQDEIDRALARAKALLDLIPNREVPPGEQPTKIDDYFDSYDNWEDIAYRLAAMLGLAVARTPEAERLWLSWAHGRPQKAKQDALNTWRSVIGNTSLRYGDQALAHKAAELKAFAPAATFPSETVDPDNLSTVNTLPLWTKLREEWALFKSGGFVDLNCGDVLSPQAFSAYHAHLAPALRKEIMPFLSKKAKTPPVADMVARQPDKLIVNALTYHPGAHVPGTKNYYSDPNDPRGLIYNRWLPSPIRPCLVPLKEIGPWFRHLVYVLGSVTEARRFIRWCAFVVQRLGEKPNWHWMITSNDGLGKDSMMEPVRAALNHSDKHPNCVDVKIGELDDNFNGALENKLIIANDVSQHGEARKMWTTLKRVSAKPPPLLYINHKNRDRYAIPNLCALIVFSNDPEPAPLDDRDRRWHFFNRRGVQPRDQDYHKGFWNWLNNGGTAKVAGYLLAFPLTQAQADEFTGTAPKSTDKVALASYTTPSPRAALEDLIEEARDGENPSFISLLADLNDLARWLNDHTPRSHKPPTKRQISAMMFDMERDGGKGVGRVRVNAGTPNKCGVISAGGKAKRLWYLAPVARDGRAWKDHTDAEILDIYASKDGLPPKAAGNVTKLPLKPKNAFSNEAV